VSQTYIQEHLILFRESFDGTNKNTYSCFWAIALHLNFVCRSLGSPCSVFIGHVNTTYEDTGESPKRKDTTFPTQRKFEIKK